jgi:hypothetical protein
MFDHEKAVENEQSENSDDDDRKQLIGNIKDLHAQERQIDNIQGCASKMRRSVFNFEIKCKYSSSHFTCTAL